MSSWIKIVVPLNVSLNYISCLDLDCLSRSLSYRFASCCFQSFVNIARKCRVYQMNIVFYFEVKCTRKWFWDLFFITSVSPHSQQLALQVWRLAKIPEWLVGRVILEIELNYDFSEPFFPKPIFTLHTTCSVMAD